MMSFKEFLAVQEGVLLPTRLPASGLSKINATPLTNGQRKKLIPKAIKVPSPVQPFKPTVSPVSQVVPQNMVKKFKFTG